MAAFRDIQRRRQWHPAPVLLPGKSHGRRSLVGCSPWGREELDTTERLDFDFSLSCIGEGNGNPLQCSCLENPRDGGAWWAAVCGIAQSRTRLKWLSSSRDIQRVWITKMLKVRMMMNIFLVYSAKLLSKSFHTVYIFLFHFFMNCLFIFPWVAFVLLIVSCMDPTVLKEGKRDIERASFGCHMDWYLHIGTKGVSCSPVSRMGLASVLQ